MLSSIINAEDNLENLEDLEDLSFSKLTTAAFEYIFKLKLKA